MMTSPRWARLHILLSELGFGHAFQFWSSGSCISVVVFRVMNFGFGIEAGKIEDLMHSFGLLLGGRSPRWSLFRRGRRSPAGGTGAMG